MVSAFVLVKIDGKADISKVRHALEEPGVKELHMVLGPWDAFVRCEAEDLAGLGRIAQQIRSCPGVLDTLTCPLI